jgi:hypothetical protein
MTNENTAATSNPIRFIESLQLRELPQTLGFNAALTFSTTLDCAVRNWGRCSYPTKKIKT